MSRPLHRAGDEVGSGLLEPSNMSDGLWHPWGADQDSGSLDPYDLITGAPQPALVAANRFPDISRGFDYDEASGLISGSVRGSWTGSSESTHALARSSVAKGTSTPPLDGQVHRAADGLSEYTPTDGFKNVNGDPVTHAVFSPPDNALAANQSSSNGSVISAVNDTMGWYPESAQGLGKFTSEAFSQFFPSSMVGKLYFTDPRVLFDATNQHYLVVEELYGNTGSNSKLLIAASKDSTPNLSSPASFNADWNFYSINASVKVGSKATSIDFPQAATDGSNLYISGDQFSGNTYKGNSETVVPLSQIESGASNRALSIVPSMMSTDMTMAVVADPTGGAYFVGYDGASNSAGEYATIAHADATGKTTPTSTYQIPLGTIDNLSATTLLATEPGGQKIDASDRRVIDSKLIGSDLFALAETDPVGGSAPQLHWFEFDVSKLSGDPARALVAQGDVKLPVGTASYRGATTYNGSLASDANGDMILNFTASGPHLNPADFYEVHSAGSSSDPATFWGSPTEYAASTQPYSDGSSISRWGDYSSAIADPLHQNGFLISNEYGANSGHWATANAEVLVQHQGLSAC